MLIFPSMQLILTDFAGVPDSAARRRRIPASSSLGARHAVADNGPAIWGLLSASPSRHQRPSGAFIYSPVSLNKIFLIKLS